MLDMEAIKNFSIDKSNWKKVKFGDVVFEPKESVKDPVAEGIIHVVGLEHIDTEDMHLRRSASIEKSTTFTKKFGEGDVLFGRRRAYLKKAAKAEFEGICSGDITVMRVNHQLLLPELLPFIVNNDRFFDFAVKHSAGGLSPRVKFKDLANFEFLLPPLEYQFELSKLLVANDETIVSYNELIKKLTIYKKSVMKEFFDGNLRLGDFKEDKKLKRLDEIANYRRGSFPQPYGSKEWYDEVNGEPFVQVYDIDFDMRLKPKTKVKISKAACQKSVFAPKGTLIISIQGSIGRVAITQYDAYIDRTILIFQEFLMDIDLLYFSYVLEDLFYKAEKTAPGATIKTITKEALSAFEVSLPCLDEQIAMGKIFKSCDTKIEETKKVFSDISSASSAIKNKVF